MPGTASQNTGSTTAIEVAGSRLAALAKKIRELTGWRRYLAAAVAGAISILAMAPFFAWPVLFATLPVLVWLIEGAREESGCGRAAIDRRAKTRRTLMQAAAAGWSFAFAFHVLGLYWLREAFMVTGGGLALLWPLGVIGVPAYLALFHAVAAAAAAVVPGPVVRRVLVLALALAATEWLRGHLLTGLPWNVLGTALTYPLAMMQSVSVLGIYGLTLVAVPVLALPAVMMAEGMGWRRLSAGQAAGLVGLLPIVLLALAGTARLSVPPPPVVDGVRLRLVQPSIPQREKWQSERQVDFLRRHLALTKATRGGVATDSNRIVHVRAAMDPQAPKDAVADHDGKQFTHVIWPEAAMPFLPLQHPNVLAEIGRALPDGTQLLAGILRMERGPGDTTRVFNSLSVFNDAGQPVETYDKTHLVPFGEYLPFHRLLESIGLKALTRQRGGFTTGRTPRPIVRVSGLPAAGVLICYEAIFPAVAVQTAERPGVLINVTNDGWFGNSTGPRQHAHQARLRAVEEGLPLIRVANNGISGVFDAYGRELARLELDVTGVIDAHLPGAIAAPVYARWGDTPFLILWLAIAGGVLMTSYRDTVR